MSRGSSPTGSTSARLFLTLRRAILPLCYIAIYFAWFGYLEAAVIHPEHLIHTDVDDLIPFCEAFVVPYLLWFGYVIAAVVYLFFKNGEEFNRAFLFLATGMTVFLVVSTIWPNGHDLRPLYFERDNIFTHMVAALYQTDTPTNLWPSIHVYNSLGVHFAIMRSESLRAARYGKQIRIGSCALSCAIILSTMLIKQHSVFDVATAFLLAFLMHLVVYSCDVLSVIRSSRERRRLEREGQVNWSLWND